MPRNSKQILPRKLSTQARIVDAVRHSIFSGDLRPGDPITEIRLAEQHDVSQTTVREALVRLEHAGLVRRVHNVGTFVTQMSPREVQERLRLRVMLEGLAAMEAARLLQPRHLAEFDARIGAMSQAADESDYIGAAEADLNFHRLIWTCSGDNTLYQVLDQITVPLMLFVSLERQRVHQGLANLVPEHRQIVDTLRVRNPGLAQEALRAHLESSYAEFGWTGQSYTLAVG